ncbi:MAG: hypothetical protein ACI3XQ_12230, partial [Eubacteriales bacterium]
MLPELLFGMSFEIIMDEEEFAKLQKENCWFNDANFKSLPPVDSSQNIKCIWEDETHLQRHIFAMIFGAFGYSANPLKAAWITCEKITALKEQKPTNIDLNDPEFSVWMNLYAQYHVLLGTALVYLHEYIMAAYFLTIGLESEWINLFSPYLDFIYYIWSKAEITTAEFFPS